MLDDLFSKLFSVDERFFMHRYYSTRWAVIVGTLLMGVWVMYELIANQVWRVDLIVIMLAMVLTKISLMIYLQLTH